MENSGVHIIQKFITQESGQGSVELKNTLTFAGVALVIIVGATYAAQNGLIPGVSEQAVHKMRVAAAGGNL